MALSFDLRLLLSLLYAVLSEGVWLLCHLAHSLRFLTINSLISRGMSATYFLFYFLLGE